MSTASAHCLGCEAPLPPPFLDLGVTPLANSYVRSDCAYLPDEQYPLAVSYCDLCHLVQLRDIIPPNTIFHQYLYFSSYSDSYLAHARAMADTLITSLSLGEHSTVVEVASNDGYLLQYFQQKDIPVLGVEPAENIARAAAERGIPTLNCFFNTTAVPHVLARAGRADLIVGNNVLAHVPAINDFLAAARSCLKPTGTAVFEFPHLLQLVRNVEFDTIYHEHFFYYSLHAVRRLAERCGLEVYDVSCQEVHGGSLRVFLQQQRYHPISPAVQAILEEELTEGLTRPDRYAQLSGRIEALRRDLISLLTTLRDGGNRIAGYGAPAKGNTLLNYCGIGPDLVCYTVDRNPHKQGCYLPGSRIPIHEPGRLLVDQPDYVLILPWNLTSEIVAQMGEYTRRGGRFIVPVPVPRIMGVETEIRTDDYDRLSALKGLQ
ncbi:MAG: class I SAM-dependent methyltransferase [Bryobacteraceae bacterium]|nr:class I SAM-dependent methyltransferase [Bryobacteraceae bacterium]